MIGDPLKSEIYGVFIRTLGPGCSRLADRNLGNLARLQSPHFAVSKGAASAKSARWE
jgi:hypothetical protein